jgi:GAF domain-containing protein
MEDQRPSPRVADGGFDPPSLRHSWTSPMRHDIDRLATLKRLMILESSAEAAFDDIATSLAAGLEVPITIVNLLDANRDWFKACVGLPVSESPASTSFCQIMFDSSDSVIVVPDTTLDPRFAEHPFVQGSPHLRFYAASRLLVDGQTVGTICAYDFKPRELSAQQIENMQALAKAATELLIERLNNPPRAE